MSETIQPLAYGLLNTDTLKLRGPNFYVREDAARAAAGEKSSRFAALVSVPLFGPEALVESEERTRKAEAQAAASSQAEAALRGEAVALRNEIATLKGRLMADKHAAAG